MATSMGDQDEPNRALRLATRGGQDGAILPARDYPPCPARKISPKAIDKSFIDQACSVKIAGYCLCSFFASSWTLALSRSINKQKRTWPIYPAILTEQAW